MRADLYLCDYGFVESRTKANRLISEGKVELSGGDFISEFHGRVFDKIVELERADQYDFSLLGEFFTPDEMGRLQGLEQKRRALTENGRELFLDCVNTVKSEKKLTLKSDGGIDSIRLLLEQKRGAQKK